MSHYYPFLKGKRGEMTALGDLKQLQREGLTPVVEVPLVSQYGKNDADTILARLNGYAGLYWGGQDTIYFSPRMLKKGDHKGLDERFSQFIHSLHTQGVRAAVCLTADRLTDFPSIVEASHLHGLMVRFKPKMFDADLHKSKAFLHVVERPSGTSAVIDLGSFSQNDGVGYKWMIRGVSAEMPVEKLSRLILAGTSIPKDFPDGGYATPREMPRHELELWYQMREAIADRTDLAFGDYGTGGASMKDGDPVKMTVAPKLSYTAEDRTYFFRERLDEKRSYSRFREICERVTTALYYSGETFSEGDAYLQGCANGTVSTGNAERWIRISTNHHLALTRRQVLRLPLPPANPQAVAS